MTVARIRELSEGKRDAMLVPGGIRKSRLGQLHGPVESLDPQFVASGQRRQIRSIQPFLTVEVETKHHRLGVGTMLQSKNVPDFVQRDSVEVAFSQVLARVESDPALEVRAVRQLRSRRDGGGLEQIPAAIDHLNRTTSRIVFVPAPGRERLPRNPWRAETAPREPGWPSPPVRRYPCVFGSARRSAGRRERSSRSSSRAFPRWRCRSTQAAREESDAHDILPRTNLVRPDGKKTLYAATTLGGEGGFSHAGCL